MCSLLVIKYDDANDDVDQRVLPRFQRQDDEWMSQMVLDQQFEGEKIRKLQKKFSSNFS